MTEITTIPEENFIPIAKKVKFPWLLICVVNIYFLALGLTLGFLVGNTYGLAKSIEINKEVIESLERDGITEGYMPW